MRLRQGHAVLVKRNYPYRKRPAMQVRRFLSLLVSLLVTGFIATAPQFAGAQPKARFAPEISSFDVDVSEQPVPG